MGKVTLVSDVDGTLHDSMYIYRTALRSGHQLLVDRGEAPERPGEIAGYVAEVELASCVVA